ncbi:MAG: ParB N-terminal domain-containing protein [Clostridia bacterium]|nr:ParB N-terminal domain-containing protein [Clostridia bacterium]
MFIQELLKKLIMGERDGEMLWKIPLGEINCEPITDPSEGVVIASLAENILRCGLLQPILLRKPDDGDSASGRYELIAGRRRLEAVRMLGRTHIQAILLKCTSKQAGVLRLAENLVRKDPHYLELAALLLALERDGWSREKLTLTFSLRADRLDALERLAALPQDQQRAIRSIGIDLENALRLADLADDLRRAVLHKCVTSPSTDPAELIKDMTVAPDVRLTQTRKVMVSDIRAFQNTVERAIDTMRTAGFDASVCRDDEEESYTFEIRIAKRQGQKLVNGTQADVSRETFAQPKPPRRFSSALNIFEALAEDECEIGMDVSRETLMEGLTKSPKNAEKLELCIDGSRKK